MKVTIIAVGKIKERYLKEGIEEYSKRLSRFCDLRIIEADEPAPDDLSAAREEQIKSREASRDRRTGTGVLNTPQCLPSNSVL